MTDNPNRSRRSLVWPGVEMHLLVLGLEACLQGGDGTVEKDGACVIADSGSDSAEPDETGDSGDTGVDDDCDGASGACGRSGAADIEDVDALIQGHLESERAGVDIAVLEDGNDDGEGDLRVGSQAADGAWIGARAWGRSS